MTRPQAKVAAARIREDWIRDEAMASRRILDEVKQRPTDPRQIAALAYRRARYTIKHGSKQPLAAIFNAQRAMLREFLNV